MRSISITTHNKENLIQLLKTDVEIKSAKINNDFLEINFNDGVNFKLEINKIIQEFSKDDLLIQSIKKEKWDSNFKNIKSTITLRACLKVKKCMNF